MESSSGEEVGLIVKFSGRSIPLSLTSSSSSVKDVKLLLQPLTNILPRGQKLIYKGRVLSDDAASLNSYGIINGSKVMLVASQGLHQGDAPLKNKEPSRPLKSEKVSVVVVDKTRSERWKLTGVIALSDSQLRVIPDEVLACGSSVRLLDLSKNYIQEVPAKISGLSSIQKLLLNANDLVDECFSWEGVVVLKCLTVLSLSQNSLTTLPSSLKSLSSLRELDVANNKLTSLPVEIGYLRQLQILKANNNRITVVPFCIGNCSSLIEIDLSSNLLVEFPETVGQLRNLKALHLRNNGLRSLPSTLFKLCTMLSTLDLHGTEITVDVVRQFEGWQEFDERRRSKLQKKLDFNVGGAQGFDEGADNNY
ncbi:Plant intracellular Ras-group-related LRR protein 8 [Ranunculus cassubicifolius]